MNKKGFSLIICLASLVGSISVSSFGKITSAEENSDVACPMVTPKGKTYSVLAKNEFEDNNSITFVYNHETEVDSFFTEYGFVPRVNGNNQLFLQGMGGNYCPSIKCFKSLGDVSEANGVMIYIDSSEMHQENDDGFALKLEFILRNAINVNQYLPGSYERNYTNDDIVAKWFEYRTGAVGYYMDEKSTTWKKSTMTIDGLPLPDKFVGYVYFDFTSFTWNFNQQESYNVINEGINKGFRYPGVMYISTTNLGKTDSQNNVYFDDYMFVKEGSTHRHNFKYYKSVKATCLDEGYAFYRCEDCGQMYKTFITPSTGHIYEDFFTPDGDAVLSYCSECGHLHEIHKDPSTVDPCEDEYFKFNLHYGLKCEKSKTFYVKKGTKLDPLNKFYLKEEIGDPHDETYTFIAWSNDPFCTTFVDPFNVIANQDCDFYATYVVSSYDNIKFDSVAKLLFKYGNAYGASKNYYKAVFIGNSNVSLYQNLEGHMRQNNGFPALCNSVAGSTSYDYLNYIDPLVIAFKPKLFVFNLSSNDQAYWSVSDKDIIKLMKQIIEYVHEKLPNCVIAVINSSLLPGRTEQKNTIPRVNDLAQKELENYDYAEYVDAFEYIYNRSLDYPIGWDFWTHLNQDSYRAWFSVIKERLLDIIYEHDIVFGEE